MATFKTETGLRAPGSWESRHLKGKEIVKEHFFLPNSLLLA